MPIKAPPEYRTYQNMESVAHSSFGEYLSLRDVWRIRTQEETNVLWKILGGLAVGQQALAGMALEMKRRSGGYDPQALSQAALKGVAGKASFQELTGNFVSGLLLDIIADPIIPCFTSSMPPL